MFKGSPFIWWNGRVDDQCIFKRLDRMVANEVFQENFRYLEVQHLDRTGSDYAHMPLTSKNNNSRSINLSNFSSFGPSMKVSWI